MVRGFAWKKLSLSHCIAVPDTLDYYCTHLFKKYKGRIDIDTYVFRHTYTRRVKVSAHMFAYTYNTVKNKHPSTCIHYSKVKRTDDGMCMV